MVKHKSLNNSEDLAMLLTRIGRLKEDSEARWGKMNAAQMLEHCTLILQTATGEVVLPKTNFVITIIGRVTKYAIWLTGVGIPPNMPTYNCVKCDKDCNFQYSRNKLVAALNAYSTAASQDGLKPDHRLFGRMDRTFWGLLEYKHLDHHLKQFRV